VRFCDEQVLPRIINHLCAMPALLKLRERVCADLAGEVVEIGFGSGLNLPYYPAGVRRVAAIEPAELGWKLAAGRMAASSVPVERSGPDGQLLPFGDDSFDAALSTWTLCTIPDPAAWLAAVRPVRSAISIPASSPFGRAYIQVHITSCDTDMPVSPRLRSRHSLPEICCGDHSPVSI